jgi:hypothetical protein
MGLVGSLNSTIDYGWTDVAVSREKLSDDKLDGYGKQKERNIIASERI